MVDKPIRGQLDWDIPLDAALDTLEADATAKAENARIAAISAVGGQIAASRDRATHTGTQDASTVTGLTAAINNAVGASVVTIGTAQTITGAKSFTAIPVVPDGSFGIAKLNIAGRTGDLTTKFLRADGIYEVPPGGGGGSGSVAAGANALGTFANPVTDPNAARPSGLTRVVWDCVTDPVNWVNNDYNLQPGS